MSQEFSRRDFLKLGTLIAGATIGGEILSITPLNNFDREISPYEIKTPNANFIQFFGTHGGKLGPLPITLERDRLPVEEIKRYNPDVIFAEGLYVYDSVYESSRSVWAIDYFHKFLSGSWNEDLLPFLSERKIPLISGDLRNANELALWESIAIGEAAPLAAVAGGFWLEKILEEEMTRGEFLQKIGAAAFLLWGLTGVGGKVITSSLPKAENTSWIEELRKMATFAEFTHPEHVVRNFRNAMIAEKLLYYAEVKSQEFRRKLNIPIIMGAGHALLSEYLRRGRTFCIDYLKLYPEGLIKHLYGKNLERQFATILEFKPEENHVSINITWDPILKGNFGYSL